MAQDPNDVMTLVCTRPVTNQTITVTIPAEIVAMLQTLSDSVLVDDPNNPGQKIKKYAYAANVLWTDTLGMLVPYWLQQYSQVQTAAIRASIDQAQSSARSRLQTALTDITVVGP